MITRREAAAEVGRNLTASLLRAILLAALAFGLGFGIVATTATDVTAIALRFDHQVRLGRFVLDVQAADAGGFSAADCDALTAVPGVVAAGSVLGSPTSLRAANRPTRSYEHLRVTPGLLPLLYPDARLDAAAARPGVLVGPTVARELGLVRGATMPLVQSPLDAPTDRRAVLRVADVLPHSPRQSEDDAKVLEVAAPQGSIHDCLVEAHPDRVEAVQVAALGWFDTPKRPVVVPFLERPLGRTPEHDLPDRASRFGWLAAAALLAALHLTGWFARRQDVALYRLLGMPRRRLALLVAADVAITAFVPVLVGMSFAMVALQRDLARPLTEDLATADLASLVLTLVALPALALAALLARSPFDDLKGA